MISSELAVRSSLVTILNLKSPLADCQCFTETTSFFDIPLSFKCISNAVFPFMFVVLSALFSYISSTSSGVSLSL